MTYRDMMSILDKKMELHLIDVTPFLCGEIMLFHYYSACKVVDNDDVKSFC